MKFLTAIFIFCVVLFLYLHVYYHLKVSNDLEIYTIEQPSKDKLEEICDLRQPVVFDFHSGRISGACSISALEKEYGSFDLNIRNVADQSDEDGLYVPLLLKEGLNLFRTDTTKRFITENNSDFLEETGVIKTLRHDDLFLRPPMVSRCTYDVWSGSVGSRTPLRYSLCYRNFICLTSGAARVKLIPPQASRYLYTIKDYDNFEYRSPVNPWDVQPQFRVDLGKIKSLDLELKVGTMVYIPAYWWYSIAYDDVSCILSFQYRTYMNTLTILPEIVLHFLQKQNVKIEAVEKVPPPQGPAESAPAVRVPPEPDNSVQVQPMAVARNNVVEPANASSSSAAVVGAGA